MSASEWKLRGDKDNEYSRKLTPNAINAKIKDSALQSNGNKSKELIPIKMDSIEPGDVAKQETGNLNQDSELFNDDDSIVHSQKDEDNKERLSSPRTNQEPGKPLTDRDKELIPKIMKEFMNAFKDLNMNRDAELNNEIAKIHQLINEGMNRDLEYLDRIDTDNIIIYNAITRYRLRIVNQSHEIVVAKYAIPDCHLIDFCFLLTERNPSIIGYEMEKLTMIETILTLVLLTLEYGLFPTERIRNFLRMFFLKCEFINKYEEYICKNDESFGLPIFKKLMSIRSLCSQVLLQVVTMVNDDWLYHYISINQIDELVQIKDTGFKVIDLFKRKTNSTAPVAKAHNVMICDTPCYSFFSFIMFNYLLKELRKSNELISDRKYIKNMNELILYVYDYREDPFIKSLNLLKPEYLNYYVGHNVEADHIRRAIEILKMISDLRRKFVEKSKEHETSREPSSIDRFNHDEVLEMDVGNIFGTLEILMGLQDETYSIRLMLTEMKVPELLVDIFTNIRHPFIGSSGDELIIQGLKVLYQLCRGNYPGQAQITKGSGWLNFKKLITGNYSVFNILFLKQLFEDDTLYLHINQDFAIEVIDLFKMTFDNFFRAFNNGNPVKDAKELVSLYAFKQLVNLFIKTHNIPENLKQNYNLPIGHTLAPMVEKFAFILFNENYFNMQDIYEPKLLTKNWKLEDGSFLVSLMMLSGDHIKCMLVDFAYSLIKLLNKACDYFFPSKFYESLSSQLPLSLNKIDYLLTFSEGLKFKSEIMNSYCIFRIFAQSSLIPETYTLSELSTHGMDTNLDFLPDSHLVDLPNMIVSELIKFQRLHTHKDSFEKEELIEYLVKGLCQMCYKYVTGVIYYFLSIETRDVKKNVTVALERMSREIQKVARLVLDDRPEAQTTSTSKPIQLLKRLVQDPQSGINADLERTLIRLFENLEGMFAGTQFMYVLKKYDLNLNQVVLNKLKVAKKLLKCEASYLATMEISKKKRKTHLDIEIEEIKAATSPDILILKGLIKSYKSVKKGFLKDKKKNKFFEVLQSKMENTNQYNLISYICHSLDQVKMGVCDYNSLWFSKSMMNTIVFLNNTMYWCQKTRIKLFEYLAKFPKRRSQLISAVYKAQRDTFTILAYSPYINEQWEHIYARFFIFSSFIKGLCKQNCQEFKTFLGEFKPMLGCRSHEKLEHTVLLDLVSVMIKFLNFSGVSFNKTSDEYPSDRLSTVLLTEGLMRCIIDILTGPCKPNQLKVYNKGTVVWLNIFNRVITDLDSNYYDLMNIMMDYLLSFIEGNTNDILKSYSSTFDVPVLYNVMVKLLVLLWKRVMIKRKKDIIRKRMLAARKQQENLQGSKNSLKSSDSGLKPGEKSSQMIIPVGAIDEKIGNWTDLISMYMAGDFENHVTLACSVKIFIFLSRVSYKSKKYQIFFDIKENQLKNEYINAGFKEEEIRLNKVYLKGKTKAPEDLIVYYFMKTITSRVEIKDSNQNSEIFIFPKQPMCFFLRETTKNNFTETCQIENTEAKLIDMFESFEQFYLEMQSYQGFKSKYRFIGKFATDKSFKYLRVFCYFLGIIINTILLYDVEFRDFHMYESNSTDILLMLSVLLDLVSLASLSLWILSNFNVAWIESYRKFKVKHPYRNPYQPINLSVILSDTFLRKDVINFLVHVVVATTGAAYTNLVQCFHLTLIVNISETTMYVIKAITKHFDQLLATITLVFIFIFIFSNFLGKFYGTLFNPETVNNIAVCSSLKGCFFTTVNLGLRLGGGIAEAMLITDVESKKYNFYGKLMFDLGFFIFVNIVSLNVIFGIIIDTFSELRAKQREREWDFLNKCDICGIERKIFEKRGMEFSYHKIVEHNMWDYVFYLVYLHSLDEQSLTGFEYFVLTKFKQKSTAWLPINSTIFLKSNTDETHDETVALLQKEIRDMAKTLDQKIDEKFGMTLRVLADIRKQLVYSKTTKSEHKYLDDARSMDLSKDIIFNPHMRTTAQDIDDSGTGTTSRRNYD